MKDREIKEYDEKRQDGIAPGSWWRVLTPKQQVRVLVETVREVLREDRAEEQRSMLKDIPAPAVSAQLPLGWTEIEAGKEDGQ